jgi:hypothetical protein
VNKHHIIAEVQIGAVVNQKRGERQRHRKHQPKADNRRETREFDFGAEEFVEGHYTLSGLGKLTINNEQLTKAVFLIALQGRDYE